MELFFDYITIEVKMSLYLLISYCGLSFAHWISIDAEMEEREQEINDLVEVIVGNLNNEQQHGHNFESDMMSSHSDLSLENDNHIANSNMSLPSHLNSDESIELLLVNQVGGSVSFPSKDEIPPREFNFKLSI